MSTVQEIEAAIQKLPPHEINVVADWLQEYREQLWDRQIETDAAAGRLDQFIAKAKAGYHDAMEIGREDVEGDNLLPRGWKLTGEKCAEAIRDERDNGRTTSI